MPTKIEPNNKGFGGDAIVTESARFQNEIPAPDFKFIAGDRRAIVVYGPSGCSPNEEWFWMTTHVSHAADIGYLYCGLL
jgi:hypothetical protein